MITVGSEEWHPYCPSLETNLEFVHEENYNLNTSSDQELSMSKKFTCHYCNEIFSPKRNVELHIDFVHELKNHNG